MKKLIVKAISAACIFNTVLVSVSAQASSAGKNKPNVIVIYADNQRGQLARANLFWVLNYPVSIRPASPGLIAWTIFPFLVYQLNLKATVYGGTPW